MNYNLKSAQTIKNILKWDANDISNGGNDNDLNYLERQFMYALFEFDKCDDTTETADKHGNDYLKLNFENRVSNLSEDDFKKFASEYNLTPHEQAQAMAILHDAWFDTNPWIKQTP